MKTCPICGEPENRPSEFHDHAANFFPQKPPLLPDDDTAVERLTVALYAAVNSHRHWADEALETHAEWIIQRLREARALLRREVGE